MPDRVDPREPQVSAHPTKRKLIEAARALLESEKCGEHPQEWAAKANALTSLLGWGENGEPQEDCRTLAARAILAVTSVKSVDAATQRGGTLTNQQNLDQPGQENDPPFQFGRVTRIGSCCNKPVGCTMRPEGCLWKRHPWKLANIDGDPTVPCQASATVFNAKTGKHQQMKCTLPSDGHASHVTAPTGVEW